jgi:hypothetical protein
MPGFSFEPMTVVRVVFATAPGNSGMFLVFRIGGLFSARL